MCFWMHFNCQLLVLFCHWFWFQCNVIVFTHKLIQLFNLHELTSLWQNTCVSVSSPLTKAVARGSFKLWTIIGALHCEFSRSYPNKSGPWVAERSCRVTLISQSSQNVWTIEISGIRWMHSKWRPDLFAARAASGTGPHGAETWWLNLRFCVMPGCEIFEDAKQQHLWCITESYQAPPRMSSLIFSNEQTGRPKQPVSFVHEDGHIHLNDSTGMTFLALLSRASHPFVT